MDQDAFFYAHDLNHKVKFFHRLCYVVLDLDVVSHNLVLQLQVL